MRCWMIACAVFALFATVSRGFDQTTIPGCVLFLAADDVTTTNGNVMTWNDRSSSANHFTALSAAVAPTFIPGVSPNGAHGGVKFNGARNVNTGQYLYRSSLTSGPTAAFTMFVVYSTTPNPGGPALRMDEQMPFYFAKSASISGKDLRGLYVWGGVPKWGFLGMDDEVETPYDFAGMRIATIQLDSAMTHATLCERKSAAVDTCVTLTTGGAQTALTPGNIAAAIGGGYPAGIRGDNTFYYSSATVSSVLLYDTLLSAGNRQTVSDYLYNTYFAPSCAGTSGIRLHFGLCPSSPAPSLLGPNVANCLTGTWNAQVLVRFGNRTVPNSVYHSVLHKNVTYSAINSPGDATTFVTSTYGTTKTVAINGPDYTVWRDYNTIGGTAEAFYPIYNSKCSDIDQISTVLWPQSPNTNYYTMVATYWSGPTCDAWTSPTWIRREAIGGGPDRPLFNMFGYGSGRTIIPQSDATLTDAYWYFWKSTNATHTGVYACLNHRCVAAEATLVKLYQYDSCYSFGTHAFKIQEFRAMDNPQLPDDNSDILCGADKFTGW